MASAPSQPPADKARLGIARSHAEKLSSHYSRPPIPVLEVAQRQGVRVVPETFTQYSDSVAGLTNFREGRIHCNIKDPPEQQAFTIAHELGHWLLHRSEFIKDPKLYSVLPRFRLPEPTPFEQEATVFAAHLLVPERLLRPVMHSAPPTELARIFGVPLDLLERRLRKDV
jgi:Zn-dependent peptidase ImmA (M78 family)